MSQSTYADLFLSKTPQTAPIHSAQVQNNAGGFVFQLNNFKRLERFLILGSDSNTYYSNAQKLTVENANCVLECLNEDPLRTINLISDISHSGRAVKNDPCLFALALATISKDVKARKHAYAVIPVVCRTSTHLFQFVNMCDKLGKGWGRGFKNAIANWYNNKDDDKLAYQLIKYRQREGYTHERLIRLCHPKQEETTLARRGMYDWLRHRETINSTEHLPNVIKAHNYVMTCEEDNEYNITVIIELMTAFHLPWEALPTWSNTKKAVWQSMLPSLGLTAIIRNLGNMTRLGVFENVLNYELTLPRLMLESELAKARIHPFNLLNALHTYKSGHGFRGSNTWNPIQDICNILEESFYKSFKLIEPSNKRIMLALDVSGSMEGSKLFNSDLSAREASSAMAMSTLMAEENVTIAGFTSLQMHNYSPGGAISPLSINRGMKLDDIVYYTRNLPFSGTDCSLPMLYAIQNRLEIDAFVIYTDSETWTGRIHPTEALKEYREKSGISDAKLIVVGMTSTGFSIADPNDLNMLDVVGFDSDAPSVISDFIRGENNQ